MSKDTYWGHEPGKVHGESRRPNNFDAHCDHELGKERPSALARSVTVVRLSA
jgi:hypothetical protein